jgi:hypothetical protein
MGTNFTVAVWIAHQLHEESHSNFNALHCPYHDDEALMRKAVSLAPYFNSFPLSGYWRNRVLNEAEMTASLYEVVPNFVGILHHGLQGMR